MGRAAWEWKTLLQKFDISELPQELMEQSLLIDLEKEMVYLSQQTAMYLMTVDKMEMSIVEFMGFLAERSREILTIGLARIKQGKSTRMDNQLNFIVHGERMAGMVTLAKVKERPYVFGLLHVNYELTDEYQKQLNVIISERNEAQRINQLVLEGSTDYIYHLDLVNDVCTFSPKALEVLPLEKPTFNNAMDTVLSFIVPEDRNVFLESFTPFLTGKSQLHKSEYRVNTKQGTIMWISCHGKGIHDTEGRPLMIAGSLMDITEQKRMEGHMHQMLYYDILTGLKNRNCYEQELKNYLNDKEARGSVICINIQKFKVFNEIFGHDFGDKVLKEFAVILNTYLPQSLGIYRIEADHFLVHSSAFEHDKILERLSPLQIALGKSRVIEGHSVYIDVLMGIATYPNHEKTPDQLLQSADSALYALSRGTSEKIMFFMNKEGRDISKHYVIEHEVRKDIENNYEHFRLVYQPVVKLRENENYWYGAETLLRYFNPVIPDVTLEELIETLEITDLIIPVGRWILSEALRECSQWKKAGIDAHIHVNFSVQQLSDVGLLNYMCELFQKYNLDPSCLICELTETSLLKDLETASMLCWELRKLGVGIALDDFGTGYSSLNYLKTFPISQIKIDKTYVQGLLEDDCNKTIISCLFDLSKSMGLELCVEGVETKEVLELLAGMGIDIIQGFYFERPLEGEIIRKEFAQHLLI